ncbi:MAG: hydroxymethylbilane synthase [Proteobacteria bacterium]|nr:hydroxymethylbilane synthase [Pseudomonadota bacterium]
MKITIGTRSAKASLVCAKSVAGLLEAAGAGAELRPISAIGDSLDVGLAGQRGGEMFTRDLDEALQRGEIDLAVHDMSHVAAVLPANVSIAAVPQRLDPRDAFVSGKAKKLSALGAGARIGASGAVRAPQLIRMARGFEIVPVISDPEANLRAVGEGVVDGVIMSSAELARLGIDNVICEHLPADRLVPAIGQGALAVEVRSDRRELIGLVTRACHHPASGVTVKAERAFLKAMDRQDGAVYAASAEVVPSGLAIVGFIATADAAKFVMEKESGKIDGAGDLGRRLAEKLLKKFS